MAAHRTERLTLHMTAFISFQIFLYFGKILTMQNRSISFLVLYMFSAYVQPELWRGRGIPFACTAKLASNCTCGPQIAVFPDALQPHKVPAESQGFSLFMFCWNCYNGRAQHACIFILFPMPHCRSSSNCSWLLWVRSVTRSIQNWWLLKSWLFFTKYGKLGSMQNFQMGNSSSMYSWEGDVNSNPEKVNDALT